MFTCIIARGHIAISQLFLEHKMLSVYHWYVSLILIHLSHVASAAVDDIIAWVLVYQWLGKWTLLIQRVVNINLAFAFQSIEWCKAWNSREPPSTRASSMSRKEKGHFVIRTKVWQIVQIRENFESRHIVLPNREKNCRENSCQISCAKYLSRAD